MKIEYFDIRYNLVENRLKSRFLVISHAVITTFIISSRIYLIGLFLLLTGGNLFGQSNPGTQTGISTKDTTNIPRIITHTIKLLGQQKDLDALVQVDKIIDSYEMADNQQEIKFFSAFRRDLRWVFRQSSRMMYKPESENLRKRKSKLSGKRQFLVDSLLNHK